jgi:hypothetical protein
MSRFTESQIVLILMEADASSPVNELWRKHGLNPASCLQVEGRARRPRRIGTEAHKGAYPAGGDRRSLDSSVTVTRGSRVMKI